MARIMSKPHLAEVIENLDSIYQAKKNMDPPVAQPKPLRHRSRNTHSNTVLQISKQPITKPSWIYKTETPSKIKVDWTDQLKSPPAKPTIYLSPSALFSSGTRSVKRMRRVETSTGYRTPQLWTTSEDFLAQSSVDSK